MLNILMNLSKFGVLFMKLYNETFYGLLNFVEETANFCNKKYINNKGSYVHL